VAEAASPVWRHALRPLGLPFASARWFALVLVEAELLVGIWLMSGVARGACRFAAISIFSAFALASLILIVFGAESCGCFGKVAVSPWFALVIDVVALAGILLWQPQSAPFPSCWDRLTSQPFYVGNVAVVAAVGVTVLIVRTQGNRI
jgi:hypothetical protein